MTIISLVGIAALLLAFSWAACVWILVGLGVRVRQKMREIDVILHASEKLETGTVSGSSEAARRAEAGEIVAYRAEEFLHQLEKRWPEVVVTDMDEWRDALLEAISEMRMLP